MATTARTKDRGLGKDKRGTSPSNSQTSNTHSQRSSSRRQALATDKEKASSEKNIPNYLRPTISSRNEPLKLGNKKNISSHDHQDNQKLLRRRSFDKPPSAASPRRRSLISPGPSHRTGSAPPPSVPRERKLPVRSSSLGKHTVSKIPKDIPTKAKSTSFVNKEESCNNNASSSCDHETNNMQEDKEDLVKELVEEEVANNKEESETSEVVSKTETEIEDDVHHDGVVETEDDEKINSCDISTCTSEDQNLIPESRIYDDQETDEEEKLNDQVKEDRDTLQEDHQEEVTGGNGTVPEESEDHAKVNESTEDDDNNKVEEDKENREEAANEERVVEEGEEVEEAAKAVSESPLEEGQGRRESPSAAYYNDVIEETASKLLEKRKNKVRALVGAFETVIDYESAASSK